jgi:hypothetical protein
MGSQQSNRVAPFSRKPLAGTTLSLKLLVFRNNVGLCDQTGLGSAFTTLKGRARHRTAAFEPSIAKNLENRGLAE